MATYHAFHVAFGRFDPAVHNCFRRRSEKNRVEAAAADVAALQWAERESIRTTFRFRGGVVVYDNNGGACGLFDVDVEWMSRGTVRSVQKI